MNHNHLFHHETDLVALIAHDLGQPAQRSGCWIKWFCPFHPDHKTPSLAVNLDSQSWYCFGCQLGGDTVTWMKQYHHLSLKDAFKALGHSDRFPHTPMNLNLHSAQKHEVAPPSALWQQRGRAFLQYTTEQIWNNPASLAYLHKERLLNDETIRAFGLGYNPRTIWDLPEHWGLADGKTKRVWLPQGIVIPCVVKGNLWSVKIRQLQGDPKYALVKGSSPALYGADLLAGCSTLLMTEGEFDTLLAWQHLQNIADVATLGSAGKKLAIEQWGQYLLPAQKIIVTLDSDDAGAKGAQSLTKLSAQIHAVRIPSLIPAGKDITDFVQAGGDLLEWLLHHLAQIETSSHERSK